MTTKQQPPRWHSTDFIRLFPTKCRICGAAIYMGQTAKSIHWMAFDKQQDGGGDYYTDHFLTCKPQ